MLQIMCWVESEDYWHLNSLNEKDESVDFYGYRFEVDDSSEAPDPTPVKLVVVELISAKMTVGFAVPDTLNFDEGFKIGFICQERPDKPIPIECKLSDEVKKTQFPGTDLHRLEYIGFSLEKFYDEKGVKFYFHDLRPPKK